ncbi:putative No apical meristem-associated domain-containing protein [Helianthus annuus]|nr:putative No apical meristem-associated domain-containing protein [Helianthus annuus]
MYVMYNGVSENSCTNFQSIYQRQRNGWKIGESDEDIMQSALIEYQAARGNFSYLKIWKLLCNSSKWANVLMTVGTSSTRSGNRKPTKKSKTFESVETETTTSDARNVDLHDVNPLISGEEGADEQEADLQRPPGRKSDAKSRRPESSSGGFDLSQAFSEMNQRVQDIRDFAAQRMQENREVVELMKDIQFERDFEFYSKSYNHLTGKALEIALQRKAIIEKKYRL